MPIPISRNPISRRQVLQAVGAGAIAATTSILKAQSGSAKTSTRLGPICVFAKHLQWLTFEELAEYLVANDFDGIEATVRNGGQVEPENVERDLPKLVSALEKHQRRVTIMTTDVNDANLELTRRVLQTGAELGIPYYRMAYYRYQMKDPIVPQLDVFRRQAQQLAELNEQTGIAAVYQNHAGAAIVGANIWDLHLLLDGIAPEQIGVAFDVRHVTVEGGSSWPLLWQLIKDKTRVVYLKDFEWQNYEASNVPLGTGQVNPKLIRQVANEVAEGSPVSLHMEYIDHRDRDLQPACLKAITNDRGALRRLLKS